jgi:hypothetical protein
MQKEDFMIFSLFSDNLVGTLGRILMQLEEAEEPVAVGSAVLDKHVATLSALFTHFQTKALPVLQKYMKESNSARLDQVTGVFAQTTFLESVLVGEAHAEVRSALKELLYSSPE